MNQFCLNTKSPVYQKALSFCEKVAQSDANVLLIGESGTGKEVAAKYIHHLSDRRNKDFVAVNCSAFPESLLESELFGHEQGSFTGATKSRDGKIESASGGTLFLDEIGDTKSFTQIKLLRAIESKQVQRIGSNLFRQIDFRLISATNIDMERAISTAVFREDFFYRISTIVIRIPPLRERREDLDILVDFFLKKAQAENKKKIEKIVPEVKEFLHEYNYPGNIRELKNIIDRMVILSEDGTITPECLPILFSMGARHDNRYPDEDLPKTIIPLREFRRQTEADYLRWAIEQTGGNISEAARRLKISSRQLFNKINEYNLKE